MLILARTAKEAREWARPRDLDYTYCNSYRDLVGFRGEVIRLPRWRETFTGAMTWDACFYLTNTPGVTTLSLREAEEKYKEKRMNIEIGDFWIAEEYGYIFERSRLNGRLIDHCILILNKDDNTFRFNSGLKFRYTPDILMSKSTCDHKYSKKRKLTNIESEWVKYCLQNQILVSKKEFCQFQDIIEVQFQKYGKLYSYFGKGSPGDKAFVITPYNPQGTWVDVIGPGDPEKATKPVEKVLTKAEYTAIMGARDETLKEQVEQQKIEINAQQRELEAQSAAIQVLRDECLSLREQIEKPRGIWNKLFG